MGLMDFSPGKAELATQEAIAGRWITSATLAGGKSRDPMAWYDPGSA
jgi:hypothetical protein